MITPLTCLLTAAWIPFVEPMGFHRYWMVLIVPLTVVIALVYKTLKLDDLTQLTVQTIKLTLTILTFMVVAAVVLGIVTELL